MQPDRDTVYIWLDSGFTDYYGNPIMISLLNSYGEYREHYFGSFQTLSNAIRGFFPRNIKDINRNLGGLRNKHHGAGGPKDCNRAYQMAVWLHQQNA